MFNQLYNCIIFSSLKEWNLTEKNIFLLYIFFILIKVNIK